LPGGTTFVEHEAFAGCTSLTTVSMPAVPFLGHESVFRGCYAVKTLVMSPPHLTLTPVRFVYSVRRAYCHLKCIENSITRVCAPDEVVAQLGGAFGPYDSMGAVPRSMNVFPGAKSWAAAQLQQWWTKPGGNCRLSAMRNEVERTVMLVGGRLQYNGIMVLPPEMWLMILTFVKRVTHIAYL
jgi:hypothetical protein